MPSVPTPSNAGIITDDTGERHIPESTRADGSVRKAIKIRPGYKPAEDAVLYKNRTAESFRTRFKGGVIGAEASTDSNASTATTLSGSAASNKNAKRREARKKAKDGGADPAAKLATAPPAHFLEHQDGKKAAGAEEDVVVVVVDPEAEKKKKARNLTKKLKQAKELQDKKEGGQPLLPEQIAKVIKINELVRELAALGLDADGEPIKAAEETATDEVKEDPAPA